MIGKNIVLVSAGQLFANPRTVKEAIAFHAAGYQVSVVYCALTPWAEVFDEEIIGQQPGIQWIRAGYHSVDQKMLYQWARLRRKFYHLLFRSFGNVFDVAIRSFAFFSQELIQVTTAQKADLYIGHTPGALPAVVKAARKNNAKAAFDFEDFHRGEELPKSLHWKILKAVEDKYVPALSYATTAAPFIKEAYQQLYPTVSFHVIHNCFPVRYSMGELHELPVRPLKLFWFSQFVGPKRGLETVIAAIGCTGRQDIQLTLLGNCNTTRKDYFLELAAKNGLQPDQLNFIEPVSEQEITMIAAQHHIGLATELPHVLNRELCLTNKIYMYLLAGNAIIFSRTRAQSAFLESYAGVGSIYEQEDAEQLAGLLESYISQPAFLRQQRSAALELGKATLNWEQEQQVLLKQVRTTLAAI